MPTFQLDECLNSKSLAAECVAAGQGTVRRFPVSMRSKSIKDPVVMQTLGPGATLVTTDRTFAQEHETSIPKGHKGIIQLVHEAPKPATLTDYKRILKDFKARFPEWSECEYDDSVVVVTSSCVEVHHVGNDGHLVLDGRFHRNDEGWQSALRGNLDANRKL